MSLWSNIGRVQLYRSVTFLQTTAITAVLHKFVCAVITLTKVWRATGSQVVSVA